MLTLANRVLMPSSREPREVRLLCVSLSYLHTLQTHSDSRDKEHSFGMSQVQKSQQRGSSCPFVRCPHLLRACVVRTRGVEYSDVIEGAVDVVSIQRISFPTDKITATLLIGNKKM